MQIIDTGRRVDIDDGNEANLFEMTILSRYQKLNDERDEILQEGIKQGRFYHVWYRRYCEQKTQSGTLR